MRHNMAKSRFAGPCFTDHQISKIYEMLSRRNRDWVWDRQIQHTVSLEINGYFGRFQLSNNGDTLLHIAAIAGDSEVTECLLQRGYNVDIKRINGLEILYAPLHLAVINGHRNVAEVLLNHNANINNLIVNTPLTAAIKARKLDMITFLLSKEADVNKEDDSGKTPLQKAMSLFRYEPDTLKNMVETLLTSPVAVLAKTNDDAECIIKVLEAKQFVLTQYPIAASPKKQEAITSIIKDTIAAAWLELNVMFNEIHLTYILRDFYWNEPHAPDPTPVTGDAMSD